jgi:hypothetical protein
MISKTILGATAAAFIAAGSLAATTGTASATYYGGWHGHGHGHHGKICKPIYKKVVWKDRWGHWHRSFKLVDYKCWWPKRYHDWNDNWGPY